jgi:hypothetical protein
MNSSAVILALAPSLALAEPLPVPKPPRPAGSCPHGYFLSGSAWAMRLI